MASYSTAGIRRFFRRADRAKTSAEKGRAFEDLICYLLKRVPGVTVSQRNNLNKAETEEIDVAFWNEQAPAGLKSLNAIILAECKNWSKHVGSQEVSWFLSKIESRGLDFGILFAASGISGNALESKNAHHQVSLALAKKIRMIVITRAEIENLDTPDDLVVLIKRKICQLVVSGTLWP